MAHFNILFLNLVFVVVQSDCTDYTPVSASVKGNVSFYCFDSKLDTQSCYRVKWVKYNMSNVVSPKVILRWPYSSNPPVGDNRFKWMEDKQSKYLLLTKVEKKDEGLYSCEIFRGWERIVARNFSLKVTDCDTTAKNASPGSDFMLNCSEASPQNVSWFILRGGNAVALSSERLQKNGTMLFLRPALANDSAWYRCKYGQGDTQRCLDINLQVQESSRAFTTTPGLLKHFYILLFLHDSN